MNEMKSRALWSDDKTIEDLEFCVYTNGADCVIYSLHEDLVCLKERIAELEGCLKDVISSRLAFGSYDRQVSRYVIEDAEQILKEQE